MPKCYSQDLRESIIDAWDDGVGSIKKIADIFSVSPRTVDNYLRLRRESGDLSPKPNPGQKSQVTAECEDYITSSIIDNPSIRLLDLVLQVEEKFGITVSEGWMCKIVKRLGFMRKKKTYILAEQRDEKFKKTPRLPVNH